MCLAGPKHRQRFLCEVRVSSHTYVGAGNSTTKKAAEKNAAADFIQYLVRQGLVNSKDVPIDPDLGKPAAFDGPSTSGAPAPSQSNVFGQGMGPNELGQAYRPFNNSRGDGPGHSGGRGGHNQSYFSRANEQINKEDDAELLDVNAAIHGNWTIENAKSKLSQFLQMNKLQGDYKYTPIGPDHSRSFIAELTIYVKKLGRSITGRETGSNKQTASKSCALSIVRQLFHLGVIDAFQGTLKTKDSHMKPYPVNLSPKLIADMENALQELRINPVEISRYQPDTALSLLTQTQEAKVPIPAPTSNVPGRVISWSPPVPNWNCWHASNIDEGYLATATLDQLSNDLFLSDREEKQSRNEQMRKIHLQRNELPVHGMKAQIMQAIYENPVVIIKGATGSGKTTQIAQYILEDHIASNQGAYCNICVTQPRRISATSVSERIAFERGEEIGKSVGYSVRFDTVTPRPYGSIMMCTVGVLLRRLENGLRGISHIIVDEIHERDVDTDFLLVVLRDMVHTYPDLRVILMSATIDTKLFTDYFNNCPLLEVPGRTFEVKQLFLEDCIELVNFHPPPNIKKRGGRGDDDDGDDGRSDPVSGPDDADQNLNKVPLPPKYRPSTQAALQQMSESEVSYELIEALLMHTKSVDGSVLIFLPGWNIIFGLLQYLQNTQEFSGPRYRILPCHSQVPREEQRKVFESVPPGMKKIILATNIAESSITIDDIVFVIDVCKSRMKFFTSHNNLISYATVWASKTNLEQRKGRAGRVRPGMCFTLCSRARYDKLDQYSTPEMFRSPLHELALSIKLLKLGAIGQFLSKALEPPPLDAVIEAEVVLRDLKCLDANDDLTPLGRILARLPIEPRLGKMIVLSTVFGATETVTAMAAYSSTFQEIYTLELGQRRLNFHQKALSGNKCSDHVAMLTAMQMWASKRRIGEEEEHRFCEWKGLQLNSLRIIDDAKGQLLSLLQQCGFPEQNMMPYRVNNNEPDQHLDLCLALLCVGLYPNVCVHKEKRKVLTTESRDALIHKTSVNCSNQQTHFPYPFFVYGEKIRTKAVSCKQMTMISPVHLLLFGSRKVELIGPNLINLDNWIKFEMDGHQARLICALREFIDQIVVKAANDPEEVINFKPAEMNAIQVIRDLCAIDAGDEKLSRNTPQESSDREAFSNFNQQQEQMGFSEDAGRFGAQGTFGQGGNDRGGYGGNRGGYNRGRGGFGGGGGYNNYGNRGGGDYHQYPKRGRY